MEICMQPSLLRFFPQPWPNSTASAFRSRADCFVRQYTQEVFSGRTVDGRRTLSENIADNGGLAAAFLGYKAWWVVLTGS